MKCNYCGYEKNGDYEYCPQCGTQLHLTVGTAPQNMQQFGYPPQGQYPPTGYQQYPPQGQYPPTGYQQYPPQGQYPPTGYQQYPPQGQCPPTGYQQYPPQGQFPPQGYQQYSPQGQFPPQGYQQYPPQGQYPPQFVPPHVAAPQYNAEPTPTYIKVGHLLKDSLFLVICILISASLALCMFGESLPVMRILLCIFLWIAYAKGKNNTYTLFHIQKLSGLAFASYVVNYVLSGLFIFAGISYLLFGNEVLSAAEDEFAELIQRFQSSFGDGTLSSLVIFLSVFFLVLGVVWLLINIFGRKNICKFMKSLYISMGNPNVTPQSCGAAKAWFIVFGILTLVTAIFSWDSGIIYFLGEASTGAAWICISVLIGKYFPNNK